MSDYNTSSKGNKRKKVVGGNALGNIRKKIVGKMKNGLKPDRKIQDSTKKRDSLSILE